MILPEQQDDFDDALDTALRAAEISHYDIATDVVLKTSEKDIAALVETSKAADKADAAIEEAAKGFMTLAPQVKSRIVHMASKSGKGLARVVSAALEFPFAGRYPKFKNQDETTLFMMILQLNDLKATVAKSFESQLADIKAEVVNKTVDEVMEKQYKGEA